MGRIDYTPEAERDLDEIWSYIAADNRPAADRVIRFFDEKLHVLADNPLLGRARHDLRPRLRSYPIGKYLFFYRPIPEGIQVIRVLHGARSIEQIFEDQS